MHKIILALAMLAVAGLAQAQESISRSETVNSTNAAGDDITTYTTYMTSFDHGRTKVDAYVSVSTDYAPVCDHIFWTWSKPAPTTVSYTKFGEWTGRSDSDAPARKPVATPVDTPVAQKPVVVVDGPMTDAQLQAFIKANAQ